MAEHLASKGWNIIIHYNQSPIQATELVAELATKYPSQNFRSLQANLSDTVEVENIISSGIKVLGDLDLLINNASSFEPGFIAETSDDLLDRQFAVNFKAPFSLMSGFKNSCKEGNIINIVDTRITSNLANYAAYTLSKKMLWELTKMAAVEFAPEIRVNAIAPGLTLPPAGKDENYLNRLAQKIPMKKPGGIEPVLKCLDFILENSNLTGQLLFADGGENLITRS